MEPSPYDLVVIGSGPAGQKAAVCAAKMRKRVAIIDRKQMLGGVCVNTGTVPSKTFREAVLYFSGYRVRSFYGRDYMLKDRITMQDLNFRVQSMITRETEVIRAQLRRNRIEILEGSARFLDPHTLEISGGPELVTIRGDRIVVACGTRPAHSPGIPLDGKRMFDSDQLPLLAEIPRDVVVVGAGVVGVEYTSMLVALGVKVTLLDQRPALLEFVDREILDNLCFNLRRLGTTFRLGEKVTQVRFDAERDRVEAQLESGKVVHGENLLYTVGRQGATEDLNLPAAGLATDSRGRIVVNEKFQTSVEHIFAAGDVIGFPALASTSMEQGRLAALHAFGKPANGLPAAFPYGIYSIPELSMVGQTEEQLTAQKIPYEVGLARYEELVKAQMLGDNQGMLKLLFDPKSLKLLGVHVIGERAAEIVHIGQLAMSFGATIEYFRDSVFNYPTLAEAYKVAALDGLNRL